MDTQVMLEKARANARYYHENAELWDNFVASLEGTLATQAIQLEGLYKNTIIAKDEAIAQKDARIATVESDNATKDSLINAQEVEIQRLKKFEPAQTLPASEVAPE